jgi:hypothetical protein
MNNTSIQSQEKLFRERKEYISSFETSLETKGKAGLELLTKKLTFLCHSYDPYSGTELSDEEKNIIDELELNHHLDDPFHFTNLLLQMMDKVENKLKQKIH